jgi:Na+-driven multidrug efflux pump
MRCRRSRATITARALSTAATRAFGRRSIAAFGYCLALQIGMTVFAAPIGAAFVSDPVVIGEVARILPVISAGFFAAGPLMMIAMHFQAIGDAGRAAILGLSKPYLFAMPLTFALAGSVGERASGSPRRSPRSCWSG